MENYFKEENENYSKEKNENYFEEKNEDYFKKENELENKTELYVDTIKNARLARAYVPFQVFGQLYSPCESFKNGTAFPDLNYPDF